MKKVILLWVLLMAIGMLAMAQINQNRNNNTIVIQNNTTPVVIEKKVYIDRYRTVYVDRPQPKRVARKLPQPVQLLGYLWVYPEDLGSFKQQPLGIIESINAQNMYGRDNWRIPTPDELAVLENNAGMVGLGDDIYLATDHSNGVLRLVSSGNTSTDKASIKQVALNNGTAVELSGITWAMSNIGSGRGFTLEEAKKACPRGWRLPKQSEIEDLEEYFFNNTCKGVNVNRTQDCVNPTFAQFFDIYEKKYGAFWLSDGSRFIIQFKTSRVTGNQFWSKDIFDFYNDKCSVRCVLDE